MKDQEDSLFPGQSFKAREPNYEEIANELESTERDNLNRIAKLASMFVDRCNGDRREAEELFEQMVELLCDGGVLQTWRYRQILNEISGKKVVAGDEVPF